MKPCFFILLFFKVTLSIAQPMPHGMVYGDKPNTLGLIPATKLQAYMGNRTRISITIWGKVNRVTKAKGGWFILDAGNGREIAAHFRNFDIVIPANLKGHHIIAEGIAQKQFATIDISVVGKRQPKDKKQAEINLRPGVTFEVKGLMID